jgi:hypothetical protein
MDNFCGRPAMTSMLPRQQKENWVGVFGLNFDQYLQESMSVVFDTLDGH